jgi:hypothetical protein
MYGRRVRLPNIFTKRRNSTPATKPAVAWYSWFVRYWALLKGFDDFRGYGVRRGNNAGTSRA